jgi:hypothetical protein
MSELRLEYVSVSELVPYDKNPRKNDAAAEKVAELIKEYGFKKPILVDIKNNKNEIIAGHTRLKAALLLGIEKVPVIFADDLSPEQVKAFRIADNKSSEWAEWDISLLTEEISDLSETGFDIDLTGFSDIEVSNLLPDYNDNSSPDHSIYGGGVPVNDPMGEWNGMPEFNNPDAMGVKQIIVHFETWDDVREFAELVEQKITEKTKYIWFPKADKDRDTGFVCNGA